MKQKVSLSGKIRTASALIVVFLLVLATNLIDRNHFDIIQKSMTTVYEDRLVAKEYIYKISRQLQTKRNAINSSSYEDLYSLRTQVNDSIDQLINKFSETKLTETEALRLDQLKNRIRQLSDYEKNHLDGKPIDKRSELVDQMDRYYSEVLDELDVLAEIQIEEGKRETMNSGRAIDSSNFISRLEIGALILLGLMIQLVIFLKPRT